MNAKWNVGDKAAIGDRFYGTIRLARIDKVEGNVITATQFVTHCGLTTEHVYQFSARTGKALKKTWKNKFLV